MDGSHFYGRQGANPKPAHWWQRRLPFGQAMLLIVVLATILFALGTRLEGAAQ